VPLIIHHPSSLKITRDLDQNRNARDRETELRRIALRYLCRLETSKGVLAGVRDVQEAILILVLLIDAAHESCSGWQDLIDEDEDCLLWGELYALADYVDELTDCEVGRDQILLLVDRGNIRLLDFLADDWDTVGVLLADALGLSLALLEGVLVLKLGTHICSWFAFLDDVFVDL